jgi:spore coat protein Z
MELGHSHSICEALIELKSLQDFLMNSSTKYFGPLLSKIAGVDTIPFLLLKKNGLLTHQFIEID